MTTSHPPKLSAFDWVPDFARGQVRDLRVRWACAEIGKPVEIAFQNATRRRDDTYRQWQPFGQVPAFDDNGLRLFESGAILLYLGEQDARLLPRDPQSRWDAISWMIAGLNSVEPSVFPIVDADIFHTDQDWAPGARAAGLELASARLSDLSTALGEREWLTGQFTIADIMMVTVLRNLNHTDIIAGWPNLAAYQARGEARPAFVAALAAQLDDFREQPGA